MKITKEFLEKNLNLPLKAVILEETESTNSICKELSREFKEDLAVIALSQSKGKGRLGRSFFSPKGGGIYISFLLHPCLNAEDCTKITTAAAVAAAKAIDFISRKNALIKWVNDIYLDGKKVCGILTEAGFSGNAQKLDYAILGVGINLYDPENGFPDDLKEKAGSVFGAENTSGEKATEFITAFTESFFEIYGKFPENGYMNEYRSRSMLSGKEVFFIKDGEEISGTVQSINDNAQLIMKTEKGELTLFAGEVSLKTK